MAGLIRRADSICPFGPSFFLHHLGNFIRDRCPAPAEAMPVVEIHLATGDLLEVCHVVGLAQGWVALAVLESATTETPHPMRTELIPYSIITRVTIRSGPAREGSIGFDQAITPSTFVTPEKSLWKASDSAARRSLSRAQSRK